jgi:hypothetical protein
MTSIESAVYNRISTKCHAYVKYYFPDVYKKLAAQASEEFKSRKSRRNSLADIQNALKPFDENNIGNPKEATDWEENVYSSL